MALHAGEGRLVAGEPFCPQALRDFFLSKVLPSRKLSWVGKLNERSQKIYFPVFQCARAPCCCRHSEHSRTLLVQKASRSAAFLEMFWARFCCCAGVFRLTFLFSSLTMYSLTKRAWIFSMIACWERDGGHPSIFCLWTKQTVCVDVGQKRFGCCKTCHTKCLLLITREEQCWLPASPWLVTGHPRCREFLCIQSNELCKFPNVVSFWEEWKVQKTCVREEAAVLHRNRNSCCFSCSSL